MRLIFLCALFACFGDPSKGYAQITPDGSSNTTVSIEPDGRTVVGIAPATGGVSHNRYTIFNVPVAGAALDNRTIGAASIINEVTGPSASFINGPFSVLGNPADVIIANPNGISVSGGTFLNMRDLVLGTGQIALDVSGRPELVVSGGQISIGPEGLSGFLRRVDLLAHQLRINGPVTPGNDATFVATMGDSRTAIDPGVQNPGPQVSFAASGVSIDVTSSAFLNAGTISLLTNGDGPGVRLSGELIANFDIEICADGFVDFAGVCEGADVSIEQASLRTERDLNVKGNSVTIAESTLNARVGNVLIDGEEGITIAGGEIAGHRRNTQSFTSQGGVSISSRGDITIRGAADGGRALIETRDRTPIDDDDTDIAADAIAILAGGRLDISDTDLNSRANLRIEGASDALLTRATASTFGTAGFLLTGDILFNETTIDGDLGISIDAASIDLRSGPEIRLRLQSEAGGITLRSNSGGVVNSGGLIQGSRQSGGDAASLGAVTILSAAGIRNESLDNDRLGVIFGDRDSVFLQANGDIDNLTARVLSNFSIDIETAGTLNNETLMSGDGQVVIRTYKSGPRRWYTFFTRRAHVTEYSADFGESSVDGEFALIQAVAGDLTVNAVNVRNLGGDISARNVALDVGANIDVRANRRGSIHFSERCILICTSFGIADVSTFGGTVTASRQLVLQAGETITTQGGGFLSGLETIIDAGSVLSLALPVPAVFQRRGSLGNFFGGNVFWVAEGNSTTSFTALNGDLDFRFDDSLMLQGPTLFSGTSVNIPEDGEIVAIPDIAAEFGRRRGGAFAFTERLD